MTLFCAVLPASAQDSAKDVIIRLQTTYDETKDFSSLFTLETFIKSVGAPSIVNGRVYFKKPGMMRWEYTDPIQDQIISDGETLWYYIPKDKQVRIYKSSEAFEKDFFMGLLYGEGDLNKDFSATLQKLDDEKTKIYYLVDLTPKDERASIMKILMLVSKDNFLAQQINIYDRMGNITRIAFKDIVLNTGLKNSFFHFIVPSGVETVKVESEIAGPPETSVNVEIIEKDKEKNK